MNVAVALESWDGNSKTVVVFLANLQIQKLVYRHRVENCL